MKVTKLFWMSFLFFFLNGLALANTEKVENAQTKYIKIHKMTAKHQYQFSRKDVDIVKKLIHSSLAIIERKSTIYGELAILGEPFEGGENVPKKLFEPITTGQIFIPYTFAELSAGEKINGVYGSGIEKRYSSKYWDYAYIDIWNDSYGQATDFLDSDFEEFNLEFKEKIFFSNLDFYDQQTYAGGSEKYIGKDKCYAIYRFDRKVEKVEYRFYFCINRDNYNENAKYPNKWGSLVIERW